MLWFLLGLVIGVVAGGISAIIYSREIASYFYTWW